MRPRPGVFEAKSEMFVLEVEYSTQERKRDQECLGQLLRERLEERKKRKQQETSLMDVGGQRGGVFVVNVNESNNPFSSFD